MDTIKANADMMAEAQAAACQRALLAANPFSRIAIKPNYKFFRKLSGLRGKDTKKELVS